LSTTTGERVAAAGDRKFNLGGSGEKEIVEATALDSCYLWDDRSLGLIREGKTERESTERLS